MRGAKFWGKPCKKESGHVDNGATQRYVKHKICVKCNLAHSVRYEASPEGILVRAEYHRVAHTGAMLKYRYGISPIQVNAMYESQGGCCGNLRCRLPMSHPISERGKPKLHIDHDHITGKVRGLLCSNCNGMIGQSKDDVQRLRGGAEYLEASQPMVQFI